MDKYHLQVILAIAMFITTLVAGFAPFKILRKLSKHSVANQRAAWFLTLMSCFAGGVFLATSFLDILPHLSETFERFNRNSSLNTNYPLSELIVCVGFFLVYLLEEIFSKIFVDNAKSRSKEHEAIKLNGNESNDFERDKAVTLESNRSSNSNQFHRRSSFESLKNATVANDMLHSITFTVAMSFHSALEGIALGIQDTNMGIVMLFVSLMIHKGIEAYSVGTQIARCSAQRMRVVCATIIIYALMTPLGSLVGVLIQNFDFSDVRKDAVIFVLEAIAVGTFIYVTFFEVLAEERSNEFSNLIQLIAIIAGFATIAAFQYVELMLLSSTDHSPD